MVFDHHYKYKVTDRCVANNQQWEVHTKQHCTRSTDQLYLWNTVKEKFCLCAI